MSSNNQDPSYKAVLGLKKDPFSPEPDPSYYYAFDSFEQRLAVFKNLIQGSDILILVSGEPGSGKTTLLNRYLASCNQIWRPCRIRTHPETASAQTPEPKAHRGHAAYMMQDSKDPILIVDDAHELPQRELKLLLRETLTPRSSPKVKQLVLLGETYLFTTVTNFAKLFSNEITVNQIYLPGLTAEETAAYLQHRLVLAGYTGERLFNASAVKKIHQKTGGFPGPLNNAADQWLKDNYSHNLSQVLQVIILSLDLLERKHDGEFQKNVIEKAKDACKDGNDLVKKIRRL